MFWPHFKIVFLGRGESTSSKPALEGSILKLEIQRAFFLSFLFKIVALGWFKRQTPFGYFSH